MPSQRDEANKALALEAFDALFNEHDYEKAAGFFSDGYIQHSARISAGRNALFDVVRSRPPEYAYELGRIMTEDDFVMMHGRFSGRGPGKPALIALDILRIEGGMIVEHWDVLEEEASREVSMSGLPMFGEHFPDET